MLGNITEFAVVLGATINWLSAIIGVSGALFGIYIWFYDRENKKKATLYFPLFLACSGIIEAIKNHENLGEERTRDIFASCARTLDEIVYSHGSIIYLKKDDDLSRFLSLKKDIDMNLKRFEQHNWIALKGMFKGEEFKEIEKSANALMIRCSEEVKSLKKLSE